MNSVFGIRFSPHTESELVSMMTHDSVPPGSGARTVVTTNLDHVVRLPEDAAFRTAYEHAWAVTADGMPVHLYAKLRGAAAPTRVPGADLVRSLFRALDPERDRVFMVASDFQTAEQLHTDLNARGFPLEAIHCVVPPHGFETDANYSRRLAHRIRRSGTTHLVFGVGAPKSEVWIDRYRHQLGDCYALAVGAGLEFLARTKRRAPRWMQRCGLEWTWRLGQEPRRLWRRYLLGGWRFLIAVRHDLQSAAR